MRDEQGRDGRCPVADDAPTVFSVNQFAIELYGQARMSAQVVQGDKKNVQYIRPEAVEALMRLHQVSLADQPEMMEKLLLLQNMDNDLRPNRPPPKKGPTGGRPRGRSI